MLCAVIPGLRQVAHPGMTDCIPCLPKLAAFMNMPQARVGLAAIWFAAGGALPLSAIVAATVHRQH